MRSLRKREKRGSERADRPAPPPKRAEGPTPLMLLLPDAGGIATYQLNQFPSAKSAEFFLDSTMRGQVGEGAVFFWALTWRPELGGVGGGEAEPLVIIRDVKRAVVYPFSFSDMDSALDFVRHEMQRGLDLGQVMVYWALPARIEIDFWGRSTIIPPAAPQRHFGPNIEALTRASEPPQRPAPAFEPTSDVTPARPVNGMPSPADPEARYLTEADIAEAVKMMNELTDDAPAATEERAERRLIHLPISEPHSRESIAGRDAEVIDFPTASQKFQEARSVRQAWANFALALDEALDAYVSRQVTIKLAWNRIMRAIGQAIEASKQRAIEGAAIAEQSRTNVIKVSWSNAALAIGEAADERKRQVAAIALGNVAAGLRDSMEHAATSRIVVASAWQNASVALREAVVSAEKTRVIRRAWLNAAWTLEEAVYAAALEQKVRAIRAWRHATVAITEAYEARLAYEAALRRAWSNAGLAVGEAHDACLARREMFRQSWHSATVAVAVAGELQVRSTRVRTGLRFFFIALDEAIEAKAYRDEVIDAWDHLSGQIVAAAKAQVEHEGMVAAWDNVAFALDGLCRAYVQKQKRAMRAWAGIAVALGGALEAKARQDAAITAWTNISTTLREAVLARLAYEGAVAAWQNAGAAIAEAVDARAMLRRQALVERWQNVARALDQAAKACIAKQVALEIAWSRLTVAFDEALQAKRTRDAAVAAWSNASLALGEVVGAFLVRRALVTAWGNAAIAIGEAASAHLARQSSVEAWTNASLAIKEAVVAEAKLRIAQAGLDKDLMAEVEKAVKDAQKAVRRNEKDAKGKKSAASAPALPEPTVVEVKLPDSMALEAIEEPVLEEAVAEVVEDVAAEEIAEVAAVVEDEAEEGIVLGEAHGNGNDAANDDTPTESEVREAFRGLWRIHEGSRWEPREEPFRGFQSPPGRFHHTERKDQKHGL